MNLGRRAISVAASGAVLLAAAAAWADPLPPQGPRFPPEQINPIAAAPEAKVQAVPMIVVTPDARVESTELGYDSGVAPALGRTVTWQGNPCLVVEVSAKDGGPTFSGGSRHVIGVAGSRLLVALKFADPDSTVGPGVPVAARQ